MAVTLREKKRAAIIEAAIYEFNAAGFNAATMNGIAARAQVSKRTIYNHFDNKEALFHTIAERVCEVVEQAAEVTYDRSRPVEAQLTELACRQLDLLASEEFLTMARVTLPTRIRNPELAPTQFAKLRLGTNGVGRWMSEAQEAGALQFSDPRAAGRRFIAMLLEFAFWPVLTHLTPPPDEEERAAIIAETVDLFLNGCQREKASEATGNTRPPTARQHH
ncbi:TetR/AcrR family transcriptional regulator [Roseibacillus ishigakijimensis]|nr:TetR/AcrR family transcriptional regulator [Roseibacillus ishigakijimensis]